MTSGMAAKRECGGGSDRGQSEVVPLAPGCWIHSVLVLG